MFHEWKTVFKILKREKKSRPYETYISAAIGIP